MESSQRQASAILQETEKETIQSQGIHFQTYTWKGNDTIILLAHGWESNASRWETSYLI
jgi:hypothetical protein